MISFDRFVISHHRWLHALRIMLTCTIAVLINWLGHVPYGMWSLITIIVVMSATYLGAVWAKANQRIGGTIIGALLGLSLYFLPTQDALLHNVLFLLMIGGAMYFTIGKFSYGAVLIGITLTLVAASGPGDLSVALWRTVNVLWGAILSMLCSRFLFPARATKHFQLLSSQFLTQFSKVYQAHNKQVCLKSEGNLKVELALLLSSMAKQTALQPNILKESPQFTSQIKAIINGERRVLTILEALVATQWQTQQGHSKLNTLRGLGAAKHQLSEHLSTLGEQIDLGHPCVIPEKQLDILRLQPVREPDALEDVNSDVSYYGYLWLNRELARQLCLLSLNLHQFYFTKTAEEKISA